MKKVPTVDIHATSPAGPLAQFITEDLFVSGVKPEDVAQA
jgi:sorbitol-specific phosphotransferase system component IIBC